MPTLYVALRLPPACRPGHLFLLRLWSAVRRAGYARSVASLRVLVCGLLAAFSLFPLSACKDAEAPFSEDAGSGDLGMLPESSDSYVVRNYAAPYRPFTNGTLLALVGEDGAASVPIGFRMRFFGVTYDTVSISTNGLLQFGGQSRESQNQALPSVEAPPNIIAAWWDELTVEKAGDVTYKVEGVAPSREFIVQYANLRSRASMNHYGFQVHLFEQSNRIEIHYDAAAGALPDSATVGIQSGGSPRQGIAGLLCSPGCGAADFPQGRVLAFVTPPHGFLVHETAKPYLPLVDGTPAFVSGDDAAQMIEIGFPFLYDGQRFHQVAVATNGLLSFASATTDHQNTDPLDPDSQLANILAPWWDDLRVANPTELTYKLEGAAPNRALVVEWRNLKHQSYIDSGTRMMVNDRLIALRQGHAQCPYTISQTATC